MAILRAANTDDVAAIVGTALDHFTIVLLTDEKDDPIKIFNVSFFFKLHVDDVFLLELFYAKTGIKLVGKEKTVDFLLLSLI